MRLRVASPTTPRRVAISTLIALALGPWAPAIQALQDNANPSTVRATISPMAATIGERIQVEVELRLVEGATFQPDRIGPELGRFTVLGGSWAPPQPGEAGVTIWRWKGAVGTYRTGEVEFPAMRFTITEDGKQRTLATTPVSVTVNSVLEGDEGVELSDLKPPASVPADFSALTTAGVMLLLLLLASGVAWWLHRRYADRLAAAEIPDDPFHRIPPHVWVYSELQKLLEQRYPEQGQLILFYGELARILKTYLSGRYRVALLEQTTFEVPESLRQAGAPADPIHETTSVLDSCDLVKFADFRPGPDEWKSIVETVYRIVDRTRPVTAEPAEPSQDTAAAEAG